MTMSQAELKAAIERTKAEIYRHMEELKQATEPQDIQRIKLKLKELRHLQFWHLDQIG